MSDHHHHQQQQRHRRCRIWFHRLINDSILLLLIIIIISSFNGITNAFNLDTFTALVQRGPTETYFGFSVALHKDRNVSW